MVSVVIFFSQRFLFSLWENMNKDTALIYWSWLLRTFREGQLRAKLKYVPDTIRLAWSAKLDSIRMLWLENKKCTNEGSASSNHKHSRRKKMPQYTSHFLKTKKEIINGHVSSWMAQVTLPSHSEWYTDEKTSYGFSSPRYRWIFTSMFDLSAFQKSQLKGTIINRTILRRALWSIIYVKTI